MIGSRAGTWSARLAAAALTVCLAGGQLAAQQDTGATSLQWWHPLVAGAGTATLFLVDEPLRDFLQDNRSDGLDDLGDFVTHFKDPEVYLISGGGAMAIGALAGKPKVTATGAQILTSWGLSSLAMIGTKWVLGRSRPADTPDDPASFDWFSGGEDSSFPSGSAAVVFSLATTVSDAVDRTPVSILLYSGATLTSWARLNSDRHWLSDVAVGALFGVTAAKLVNGEWTVFGLQLPAVWTDGRSSGLGYTIRF